MFTKYTCYSRAVLTDRLALLIAVRSDSRMICCLQHLCTLLISYFVYSNVNVQHIVNNEQLQIVATLHLLRLA